MREWTWGGMGNNLVGKELYLSLQDNFFRRSWKLYFEQVCLSIQDSLNGVTEADLFWLVDHKELGDWNLHFHILLKQQQGLYNNNQQQKVSQKAGKWVGDGWELIWKVCAWMSWFGSAERGGTEPSCFKILFSSITKWNGKAAFSASSSIPTCLDRLAAARLRLLRCLLLELERCLLDFFFVVVAPCPSSWLSSSSSVCTLASSEPVDKVSNVSTSACVSVNRKEQMESESFSFGKS